MFINAVDITGGMVPLNLRGGRGMISAGSYPLYAVTVIQYATCWLRTRSEIANSTPLFKQSTTNTAIISLF